MSVRRLPDKGWLAHYSERISAWARRAQASPHAEDAVQDTALSLLETETAAIRDAGSYFRRSVSNRTVSLHRAEALRQAQPLDETSEAALPHSCSPEAQVSAQQLAQQMLHALAQLPPACQTAFRLRQIDGLSNAEIAQRMGVSRNMVERYMMRTSRHLQDALQDWHEPDTP